MRILVADFMGSAHRKNCFKLQRVQPCNSQRQEAVVERELDGMWYPARVERARDDGCYDILYLDDGNREAAVEPEELRLAAEPAVASPNALQKAGGGQPPSEEAATKTDSDDEEYEAILARYRLAQQENPSFNDDL